MERTRRTGTLAAAAARAAVIAAALAIVAGLSGCAAWTREGRRAYLQTITVATPELSSIADGTYRGSYELKMPPGGMAANRAVSVDVTVSRGAITAIVIKAPEGLAKGEFYDGLVSGPKGVIANQGLALDSVTGASYTEKAFLKAVETALTK
jgi:uncharacterized protein with FMN-binding domain